MAQEAISRNSISARYPVGKLHPFMLWGLNDAQQVVT
jgi:hypothetical protein